MIQLGKTAGGEPLRLDLEQLFQKRLLVQGASGSGKSFVVRRLVEQTASKVPFVVLDLEGEFVTLREKIDCVVAGQGGDVVAEVRSAGLLARKMLELQFSLVADLSDLAMPDRKQYVRAFLEAMMGAPKKLHGTRLVVLDEAHHFAPESNKSESWHAVCDIASRGRKRGFCLVAATQRLSKLHKDVAAECGNVMVGHTTLDADVKRALDVMGMPNDTDNRQRLRRLEHQFLAMGPALSCEDGELFTSDPVKTSHGERGREITPPAPSRKIASVVGELADLPEQAVAEAKTIEQAKSEIAELKRENRKLAKGVAADQNALDATVAKAVADRDRHWRGELTKVDRARETLAGRITKISELAVVNGEASVAIAEPALAASRGGRVVEPPKPTRPISRPATTGDMKLGKAEQALLIALYWLHDEEVTPAKAAFYANYSPGSGTVNNAMAKLRNEHGLVDGWRLTEAGVEEAAKIADAKPVGSDLHQWLQAKLGKAERALLDVLITHGGELVDADELAIEAGYAPGTGTVNNALSTLRKIEAAVGYQRTGGIRANEVFFAN